MDSTLEQVGLTALFSRALADAGISCNVLAGVHHDHLLVPADRADEALERAARAAHGEVDRRGPRRAALVAVVTFGSHPGTLVLVVAGLLLAGAVLAAVHHAEVVAHRVGEPFGSLVLAVAVTVIEVALIVTLMVSGGDETSTLARDTVFAAVMITCNGVVGISLLVGALRTRLATFNAEGSATALATVGHARDAHARGADLHHQPAGARVLARPADLRRRRLARALRAVRASSRPSGTATTSCPRPAPEEHADPPSDRAALISLGLLVVALVAVVGLAKLESDPIEDAVDSIGAPQSAVGVLIALLVLLPETLAAVRNAQRNRIQTSFNLAYGSAIASIGLTIPAIALATIWLDGPLVLGLGSMQIVLLGITMVVGALTVLPGRATVQEGGVHLVLFLAFVFLALNP